MEREKIAVAALALLVLLVAAYFLLQPKGKPDLVLNVTLSPSHPYAGDAVEFKITVTNAGGATAREALLDLGIGNHSVAQKSITLAPGETQNTTLDWLADSAGSVAITVDANKGNVVDVANPAHGVFSTAVEVQPAENVSLFENLPDVNLTQVWEFGAARAGMSQLVGILASANESYSQFYGALFNKFGEAHLAIAHYRNGSEIGFMYAGAELTPEGALSAFRTITGEFVGDTYETNSTVGGREVTTLMSRDSVVTLCFWHEGGWGKALMYKRYFPSTQIGNVTVGDPTSCADIVGRTFNASVAEGMLSGTEDLSAAVSSSDPLLLEARAKPGADALYVRGFYDDNSAFLLMLSTVYSATQQSCPGDVITQDNKTICHAQQAQIMGAVNAEAYFRRQGAVTIVVFIIPFQGTNMDTAKAKALSVVKGVVFPGIPEYDWSGHGQAVISDCRFPSEFWCLPPASINGTLYVNVTQAEGHPFRIDGLRCTQEAQLPGGVPALPSPIIVPANGTAQLSFPCYVTGNDTVTGAIWFLQTKLFLNYTDLATNETNVVRGSLLVSKPPGSG